MPISGYADIEPVDIEISRYLDISIFRFLDVPRKNLTHTNGGNGFGFGFLPNGCHSPAAGDARHHPQRARRLPREQIQEVGHQCEAKV